MSARTNRRIIFILAGVLLLLIALFDILDDPKRLEENIVVNTLFVAGGIAIIFFNTRK